VHRCARARSNKIGTLSSRELVAVRLLGHCKELDTSRKNEVSTGLRCAINNLRPFFRPDTWGVNLFPRSLLTALQRAGE
jgi:hypothetical protein